MSVDLKNKNFLKLLDFNKNELRYLLDLSKKLKEAKYAGKEEKKLIYCYLLSVFEDE